jgi:hypothetical protein
VIVFITRRLDDDGGFSVLVIGAVSIKEDLIRRSLIYKGG